MLYYYILFCLPESFYKLHLQHCNPRLCAEYPPIVASNLLMLHNLSWLIAISNADEDTLPDLIAKNVTSSLAGS